MSQLKSAQMDFDFATI